MSSNGAVHCPTCGAAAASARARSCKYCGTRLAAVRCAACFGSLFDGNRFCPHCGAPAARRRGAGHERIGCPRCGARRDGPTTAMDPAALNDVHLDECPACAGVWLDHATFTRVCTSAAAQADAIALLGAPRRSTERSVRYLRCPLCHEQMARRNYARRSGVIVDFCPSHGMWFDHDEVRRIVEFVRAGGLDEARAADAARAAADDQRRAREARLFGRPKWDEHDDEQRLGVAARGSRPPALDAMYLLGTLVRRLRGR